MQGDVRRSRIIESLNHCLHDQNARDNGQAIFDAQMPKVQVSVFNLQSEATNKKTVLHSPSYHPLLETRGASNLWQSNTYTRVKDGVISKWLFRRAITL